MTGKAGAPTTAVKANPCCRATHNDDRGEIKLSSLLSKLRNLVQAKARGPRRYKTQPAPADEPEVTEASARRSKLPEVTKATPVEARVITRPAAASRPALARQELSADKEQTDALEEERVVDLLKGKQS